jgi:hypothetical protein
MNYTLFITEQKIRERTQINESVDDKLITSAVLDAQDISLKPIIGSVLFDKLTNDIVSGSVVDPYKTLLENYIQPFLIYSTNYYVVENIYVRERNNGLLNPTGGDNSSMVSKQMYDTRLESIKSKKEFYAKQLALYLLENNNLFPELQNQTKLYEYLPDYNVGYTSPIVSSKYKRKIETLEKYGIKITNSKYKQYPQ